MQMKQWNLTLQKSHVSNNDKAEETEKIKFLKYLNLLKMD